MEEEKAATRRGRKHPREESQRSGHYADPLSPIASTPMKRPRTKPANTKSAKGKLTSPHSAAQTKPASEEEVRYFSPRKLAKEYEDDADETDGQPLTSKETNGAKTTEASKATKQDAKNGHEASNAEKDEETPAADATADASDEPEVDGAMFSPALKVPRTTATRSPSTSSNGSPVASKTTDARVRLDAAFDAADSDGEQDENDAEAAAAAAAAVACEETSVASDEADSDASGENEFNPFVFIKSLPKYEDVVPNGRTVVLPAISKNTPKICLVLDLDETLVHCTVEQVENPHLQFPVNFNGVDYTVNVKKRPHMEYFLKQVAKQFEVVVFTASHRAYAEKLLNLIDPRRELIKYRLYRDDCLDVYGNYIKDLNVLGRQLSKVVLVDNSPHAFGYQVNNGIPIETWYDNEADDELLNLLPFLESLNNHDDVRPVVEKQFQIQKLIDALPDDLN